ncbi:MAG: two-component sensor histidine kinase [Candidatus Dactylopiibacterium carminicum]|uniref:histidine kinase n=1 Tax=Candidatus Dactylopiibacterium carminicum TaxID=857335 RepID=A0A272ET68_9RHOO|nr:ATP-binding protein [Candidatus Dactylopiibacterium carminicum]KAF7599312.1 two-component sensor histidine kinase [Candidatus Dactylopiibacterium carminicum]PAS93303.1 MAG: two-component sensor histidine kinase [Candidatus Dactylopiibacterium carminicum]PAS95703.1 MAG: two-component sensor histidine kinase [Candidatus Dactylopiibacterium carminicum]PAS99317.1 MAG: hypothetical protein BSR46_08560 [Candidatus Dactylopiibacterium carminicum]
MARRLDRIWVRFGLGIACTVLVTVAVLGGTIFTYGHLQFARFYKALPAEARGELEILRAQGQVWTPRIAAIYTQYRPEDTPWDVDALTILVGLLACLPVGLISGFWISRMVTRPISAIAGTAGRVALGDFTARAQVPRSSGELTELAQDFNKMVQALESLERERKSTLAALSHELRTPLAVQQARLHALCDGVIVADETEFRRLLDQSQHLSRLVNDLHMLSVADAGRLSLQRVPLNLAALAQDCLHDHASRLAEQGMHAELVTQGTVPHILADADRMRQVLNNLVENAIRYAHDGGWLQITLAATQEEVRLTVSDAGKHAAARVDERIFERFARLEGSRNRATGGSGLGLSIVQTLVELHGGKVGVAPSIRGGTCFTVCLPLIPRD